MAKYHTGSLSGRYVHQGHNYLTVRNGWNAPVEVKVAPEDAVAALALRGMQRVRYCYRGGVAFFVTDAAYAAAERLS